RGGRDAADRRERVDQVRAAVRAPRCVDAGGDVGRHVLRAAGRLEAAHEIQNAKFKMQKELAHEARPAARGTIRFCILHFAFCITGGALKWASSPISFSPRPSSASACSAS